MENTNGSPYASVRYGLILLPAKFICLSLNAALQFDCREHGKSS